MLFTMSLANIIVYHIIGPLGMGGPYFSKDPELFRKTHTIFRDWSDSKFHGINMGPTWVLSAPDGNHAGPINLAIRAFLSLCPTN